MSDETGDLLTVTERELHDGLVHRVQRRIELIETELQSKIRAAMIPELVSFRAEIMAFAQEAIEELRADVLKLIDKHATESEFANAKLGGTQ